MVSVRLGTGHGTGHGTGTTSKSPNVYAVWYNGTGCAGGEGMVAPGAATNSPVFSALRSRSEKFAQIFTISHNFAGASHFE